MDIALVKEQLETDLAEAKKELQQLEEELEEKPEFGMGKGSPGTQSWEMALARRERIIKQIHDLKEALSQVEKGTYGFCENCGKQINPERLEILPTATLCVNCARNQQ
jgi:DnaK suppressor protein